MLRPSRTPSSCVSGRCGWSLSSAKLRVRLGGDHRGAAEALRKWVRQAQVDTGQRAGVSTDESAELKRLRRENAELRRANEILKSASAFFAAELDRPQQRS
jgi:transposase-like protein